MVYPLHLHHPLLLPGPSFYCRCCCCWVSWGWALEAPHPKALHQEGVRLLEVASWWLLLLLIRRLVWGRLQQHRSMAQPEDRHSIMGMSAGSQSQRSSKCVGLFLLLLRDAPHLALHTEQWSICFSLLVGKRMAVYESMHHIPDKPQKLVN